MSENTLIRHLSSAANVSFDAALRPDDLLPWQQELLGALQQAGAPASCTSYAFGAVRGLVAGLPVRTLVVRYELPDQEVRLAVPLLAYEGGAVHYQSSVSGNYAPKPVLLGNPLVLGFAKQLAEAVGKSLLKRHNPELYQQIFGKDLGDISRELDELKQDLKHYLDELKKDLVDQKQQDDFFNVAYWFVREYEGTLHTHLLGEQVDKVRQYDTLEKKRVALMLLAGRIRLRLEPDPDLAACTYQARRKVELYRLVGLQYLLLLGEQLYWQRLLAATEVKYQNNDLVRKYEAFVEEFTQGLRLLETKLHKGRYAKITELENAQTSALSFYYWRDDFESREAQDPFRGDKLHQEVAYSSGLVDWLLRSREERQQQAAERAGRERNRHVADVNGLFQEHVAAPIQEAIAAAETGKSLLHTPA